MKLFSSAAGLLFGTCASLVSMGAIAQVEAQTAAGQPGAPFGRGAGGRGGVAGPLFTALDANKDGSLTRDEMKSSFDEWFTDGDAARSGTLTLEQLVAALNVVMPPTPPMGRGGRGQQAQNEVPKQSDVDAMMAVLPDAAPAKPMRARKVLVLCKAQGFVHSSIPLAAKMVEALGTKTGSWSTVITYNPADINADNLKQYDLIFLDSTTGLFLDDPNDVAATAARRKALLDFVRGGKGLAGVHAATDSYHGVPPAPLPIGTHGRVRRTWRREHTAVYADHGSGGHRHKRKADPPGIRRAWPNRGSIRSTPIKPAK